MADYGEAYGDYSQQVNKPGYISECNNKMTKYTLDTDNQIFFYEQDYYPFSNFSAFKVYWKGLWFDTSEVVYHWEKFEGNIDIQDGLRSAISAHAAFKFAQVCKDFIRPDWLEVRVPIMYDICAAKATQHPYVYKKLFESGSKELIENSWRDNFWGWGPNKDGKNMLGKIWMKVRDELKEQDALKTVALETKPGWRQDTAFDNYFNRRHISGVEATRDLI